MTKFLGLRLAGQNIRRNHQTYGPFLIASSLLTFALYSFAMMTMNPGMQKVSFGNGFLVILQLGLVVVGLFTAAFLFYANSFLIRRRKKELGLYGVLGMERRHVVKVLFIELLLSYLVTLGFGLGLGAVLARLMFLVLRALTRLNIPLDDTVSLPAMGVVAALMAALFLLLFIYNAVQVRRAKPVDLLRSQQQAEKEPKARWLLALLGIALLGVGYYLALTVRDPMTATLIFFVAVLLVIVGTYLTFLTGSVALLKALKHNKRFYYQSKHFVTVSGMLYRMKQNAAGLASIAILVTMAMVTIGTTAALYIGAEDTLYNVHPTDIQMTVHSEEEAARVLAASGDLAEEMGVTQVNRKVFRGMDAIFLKENDEFISMGEFYGTEGNRMYYLTFMGAEDYNALTGESLSLAPGEVGWAGDHFPGERMTMVGQTWTVKQTTGKGLLPNSMSYVFKTAAVVLPSWDDVLALREEHQDELANSYISGGRAVADYNINFDLDATKEERLVYGERMSNLLQETLQTLHPEGGFGYTYGSRAEYEDGWYGLYGTFLFVGAFLGLVFLMATALIIYFKQISEGYQDHDRYIILQKVGMSQAEVRKTVMRQILIVFFAPLLVALCHVAGSLPMIMLMLQMFGLMNVPFIALCSMGAAVLVALLYLIFYRRTAKSYLKLVKFE